MRHYIRLGHFYIGQLGHYHFGVTSLISPLLISPFIRVILRLAEPKDQSLLMETSPPLFANTRPILEYFRFACKIERAAFIIGLHLAIRRAARHNGFANLA